MGAQTGVTAILLSIILLAAFVFKASKGRQRVLIDLHFLEAEFLRFGCHSVHNQWPVIRGLDADPLYASLVLRANRQALPAGLWLL